MKLEFYQEVRFDSLDEDGNDLEDGVHVHFDCPICGSINVGTDMYGNLYECISIGQSFICVECHSGFKLIYGDCWDGDYERI